MSNRLLMVLAICVGTHALAQNTWYVDVNATPPGVGTPAQPYSSIQYAIDRPSTLSSDTILVAPGLYAEQLDCGSKFLVLRSMQGPLVTTIRPGVAGTIVKMPNSLAGTTFPTLEGFRLLGAPGTTSVGVTAVDVVVNDCIIDAGYDATGTASVGISGMVSIRLQRSTILNYPLAVQLNNFFGNIDETLLSNSILDRSVAGTSLQLEFCQYNGTLGGAVLLAGNIHVAPGLWSAASGDVHLVPLSPCINAADPALPLDPDGTRADIGVLRYDPTYAATPAVYCSGKLHSAGCRPAIAFSGTPSLSGPDDFHVIATNALNNKPGLILWSLAPGSAPLSGGTLCLSAPIVRSPALFSAGAPSGADCSGVFDWHFTHAYAAAHGITAGPNLYVQAWGRDPGFAAPNNAQLSNAGVFEFSP